MVNLVRVGRNSYYLRADVYFCYSMYENISADRLDSLGYKYKEGGWAYQGDHMNSLSMRFRSTIVTPASLLTFKRPSMPPSN